MFEQTSEVGKLQALHLKYLELCWVNTTVWIDKSKSLSWILLLRNIPCLANKISVHGSGQIEMEFNLVLPLALKIDCCLSLHDKSNFSCSFITGRMPLAFGTTHLCVHCWYFWTIGLFLMVGLFWDGHMYIFVLL